MQWGIASNSLLSNSNRTYLCSKTCGFVRKCLASPNLIQRRPNCFRCLTVRAEADETQIKPAYNKYRSRYEIEQDYIKQWKEVTARDSEPKKVTPLSFLWFVPVFIKYHVIPGPIRYVWWLVWSAFLRARYQIRKRLVLQGAKLDVQLMKRSMPAGSPSFCRTMVLRRLHGHVGPIQNLQYRFHLLQGLSQHVEEQATVAPA